MKPRAKSSEREISDSHPVEALPRSEGEMVSPHAIIEDAGVAYDPTTQHLDLSKEEKRRTTALMMAIQAYANLIIKDADYLKEMHNESRREGGPVIRPATIDAMVDAAIKFDLFISGAQPPTVTEIENELSACKI